MSRVLVVGRPRGVRVGWGRKEVKETSEKGRKNGGDGAEEEKKEMGLVKGLRENFGRFRQALANAKVDLADGGAARALAVMLLYPLDTCKTRLQVSSAHSGRALTAMLRATPQWYGGMLAAVGGQLGYGVLTFGMFEVFRAVLKERWGSLAERKRTILAACLGDLVGSLWLVPAESVKLKMQAGVYPNTATAVSTIMRTGGVGSFYQGFLGQVIRDMPFRALQILTYDRAKRYYLEKIANKSELSQSDSIAVGAFTGAAVGAITTPLDVIRTRVMSQRLHPGNVYSNWVSCLSGTVKSEGALALFRGLFPRTVYMAASVALFSLGYEASKSILAKRNMLWHSAKSKAGVRAPLSMKYSGESPLTFSPRRVSKPFATKALNIR